MDTLKNFILAHKVASIIAGVVVVAAIGGGVTFGVYQANKPDPAVAVEEKKEDAKKDTSKKKEKEKAEETEEVTEEAKEETASGASAASSTTASSTTSASTGSQSQSSGDSGAKTSPFTPEENQTAICRSCGDVGHADCGMTYDAYGNKVSTGLPYVVKVGAYGCRLWSDGRKEVTSEAWDAFISEYEAGKAAYFGVGLSEYGFAAVTPEQNHAYEAVHPKDDFIWSKCM